MILLSLSYSSILEMIGLKFKPDSRNISKFNNNNNNNFDTNSKYSFKFSKK